MKIKIKYSSWLVPPGFIGITLWPTIHIALSKEEYLERYGEERLRNTLNHEAIHIAQQKEMLVVFFYLVYLLNWLVNIPIYGKGAYRNISFEREAYEHAGNSDYLDTRRFYNWINHFKKPKP